MADDDDSTDELLGINDHHGAPEVVEVAPTKDPIEEATLDDVEFIDEDANEAPLLVQKARGKQTEHRTKIKSTPLNMPMAVDTLLKPLATLRKSSLVVGIFMCNASQANALSRNTSMILSVDCSDMP